MRHTILTILIGLSFATNSYGAMTFALGDVRMDASSQKSDANNHFINGVGFLHAFTYDLAIQEFQKAEKSDPDFAMAYWGEALAYKHPLWNTEDLAAAQAVLSHYHQHQDKKTLTEKEQKYLNSVEILFGKGTLYQRDQAYITAMADFYKTFPDDPNVGAFYVLAKLGFASDFPNDPASAQQIKDARSLIDYLYQKYPTHPGVLHYFLHAHDANDQKLSEAALPAAKTAMILMRSSSHVAHMSAHVFRRLARWDDFITANKISIKASDDLCKFIKFKPVYACDAENKYHSLEWLQYGYLMKKEFDSALKAMGQMHDVAAKDSDLMYQEWYYRMWARQVLLSQNWDLPAIKISPIAKSGDDLYWAAYSECGALLADSFIAIHQHGSVDIQLKRLDNIIEQTKSLTDPYIKQSCEIAKLEIQTEDARVNGPADKASALLNQTLSAQKQQISTELTPSIGFLPAEDYERDFFKKGVANEKKTSI